VAVIAKAPEQPERADGEAVRRERSGSAAEAQRKRSGSAAEALRKRSGSAAEAHRRQRRALVWRCWLLASKALYEP